MHNQRWRHYVSQMICLASAGTLFGITSLQARASQISVNVENSDRVLFADGTARPTTDPNGRIGAGFVGYGTTAYVLPFKLPNIPRTERVVSAVLSINLEGWSNYGLYLGNIDIYGIGITSSSNEAYLPENYVDGANPGSNPDAVLVQDNFLTPADIDARGISAQIKPRSSQDFGWFVREMYNSGAQPGEYIFFTLCNDSVIPSGQQRYYLISAGNSTTYAKPTLLLTTGSLPPDEMTYYLDGNQGSDAGDGSPSSPWKTFARAQQALQPGNTLYCTGELGTINMTGTSPVGNSSLWIKYKSWPGQIQPHVNALVFPGGMKIDRYLSFDGFSFAPGEVDSAGYNENNAIYLAGAWYVEFNNCDIEGARLKIPAGAIDPQYGFAPYTPIAPFPPPALTAGNPGDASYIKVTNCRIKNSAIGIAITQNPMVPAKVSTDWIVTDNDIDTASEDSIRLAGRGGSNSYIARNYIHGQNLYKEAFNWPGYSDPAIWNSRKWQAVHQVNATGTATAIIYHADVLSDGRTKVWLVANDYRHVPTRSSTNRWILDADPTIYFDPQTVDYKPSTGDSAHTDCISVMGPSHDVFFEQNYVEISEQGGPLKLENIRPTDGSDGQPTNITFQNNLFYSKTAAGGGMLLSGGRNVVFRQNTIFSGPSAPLARAIRFNDLAGEGYDGVYFYNNIIGGGGDSNLNQTNLAESDYNLWLSAPLEGFHSGTHDKILPTRSTYQAAKFVNPAAGDLHLQATSPAINIGSADPACTTPTDMDGRSRVGYPDAGAYEAQ